MKFPISTDLRDKLRPVYHELLDALNPNGVRATINGTDSVMLSAVLRNCAGQHEQDVWVRIMDEVRPGDTCLDIGASVGLYTLGFATRLRGKGRVFSFEPDFVSYRRLQRHIALNGFSEIVCAMNVAVGDRNGVLKFLAGSGPTSHAAGPGESAPCVSVASLRLDHLFRGMEIAPDILKIDVEGFELEVLKGAKDILSGQGRPRLIYLDVHPWAWSGLGLSTSEEALRSLLAGYGYDVQKRNGEFADLFAISTRASASAAR